MSNRISTKVLIVLTILACLFTAPAIDTASEGKRFRANKDRPTRVSFRQMEIEIPNGAAEEELSVEWGDPDLSGIKIPYGFKPIGKRFRFGPHGKKFSKDKALKIRLQINRKELPESSPSKNIKLFYINRERQQLETVEHSYDHETGILQAKLTHFSDYIPGITPGWDGRHENRKKGFHHNSE